MSKSSRETLAASAMLVLELADAHEQLTPKDLCNAWNDLDSDGRIEWRYRLAHPLAYPSHIRETANRLESALKNRPTMVFVNNRPVL